MTSVIINGSCNLFPSQLNIEFVNALFKNLWHHTKAQSNINHVWECK